MSPVKVSVIAVLLICGLLTFLLFHNQSNQPTPVSNDLATAQQVSLTLAETINQELTIFQNALELLSVNSFWQATPDEEWIYWLNSQQAIYKAAGLSTLGIHSIKDNTLSFEKSSLPGRLSELKKPLERLYKGKKNITLLQSFRETPSIIILTPIKKIDNEIIGALIGVKKLNSENLKVYQEKLDVPVAILNNDDLISSSLQTLTDLDGYTLVETAWPENIKSSLWTLNLLVSTPSKFSLNTLYLVIGLFLSLLLAFIIYKQIRRSQKYMKLLNKTLNVDLPIAEQVNRLSRLQNTVNNSDLVESMESIKVRLEQLIEQKRELAIEVRRLQESERKLKSTTSHLSAERDSAVAAPRLKSEFLSRMGDEVTAPMKSVVSMLKLLSEYSLEEEARELLNIAKRSSRSLVDNLNNILDFSKLDANMLRLHRTKINVRQLVDDLSSELSHFANEKGLSLQASCDPEIPSEIIADSARIRQIIRNLLGNAIRFTKSGDISLYSDVIIRNDKELLRFVIKDTGVGIPEEAQKGLFESLEQSTKLTNSSFAGRLRLIVCKSLVELMGGEIGVHSESGSGSQFWFTIELVTAE